MGQHAGVPGEHMISFYITFKTMKNVPNFNIRGQDIQYVNHYNYLRLILDNKITLTPLLKKILRNV